MKEIEIPEGYEARIEGNKVILEKKESDDERINRAIFKALSKKAAIDVLLAERIQVSDALAYLERQKEQQPAEWSKEDKNRHYYLCKLLRETWDKVDKGSCIDDAITWLEELSKRIPLHSWKPSEKQIKSLKEVISSDSKAYYMDGLESLYNDLEKL